MQSRALLFRRKSLWPGTSAAVDQLHADQPQSQRSKTCVHHFAFCISSMASDQQWPLCLLVPRLHQHIHERNRQKLHSDMGQPKKGDQPRFQTLISSGYLFMNKTRKQSQKQRKSRVPSEDGYATQWCEFKSSRKKSGKAIYLLLKLLRRSGL